MRAYNKNIFLTGATGVLGAHVLKDLLESTRSKVHCLVRAQDKAQGLARITACLKAYDPEFTLQEAFESRVIPVVGDIAAENFGLSDRDYENLACQIDVTFHVAALTNLFLNFRRIAPINVGGTENCIKFALKTPSQYLCYISTYTVMGNRTFDEDLIFKESDLDIGQHFEHMSYQRSKFIAENMVRDAQALGLKWNIFRPGQIFGSSKTGFYPMGQTNVSGLFYDIFKTVVETGVALRSRAHFDVVPVDYVSQGILTLGLIPRAHSKTYHLTNPDVLQYSEVITLLEDQGYLITHVEQEEYKKLLFSGSLHSKGSEYKSSTLSAFKWWYKKDIFNFARSCVTDCTYTATQLSELGVKCPRLDSRLIGVYTEESIRTGYFPKPGNSKSSGMLEDRSLKELSI